MAFFPLQKDEVLGSQLVDLNILKENAIALILTIDPKKNYHIPITLDGGPKLLKENGIKMSGDVAEIPGAKIRESIFVMLANSKLKKLDDSKLTDSQKQLKKNAKAELIKITGPDKSDPSEVNLEKVVVADVIMKSAVLSGALASASAVQLNMDELLATETAVQQQQFDADTAARLQAALEKGSTSPIAGGSIPSTSKPAEKPINPLAKKSAIAAGV